MQQPTRPMRPLELVCLLRPLILTKEDGLLDNQLTELEKLDAANEAIVFIEAGELSQLAVTNDDELIVAGSGDLDEFIEADEAVQLNKLVVTNKAIDELNELVVAKGLQADNVASLLLLATILPQNIVQSSLKMRDMFVQLQIIINLKAEPWSSMHEIVGTV